MTSQLEQLCIEKGLKLTDQRRVIAQVLSESSDHPDVEQVYNRATNVDSRISIATVYRTVKLFEEANILERHDFGDGRARYEEASEEHHDHLIDVNSGEVIEFCDEEIEHLQRQAAARLGYRLVGHRLELYAVRDIKLTQLAGGAEASGSSGSASGSAPGSASGGRKIDAASRRKPE
jgi:Fur family ferric uptake transcriptional regulator